VDGVSFEVRPGQVVGIVGESGSGKSVTMKAVLQLIETPGRISRGEILYRRSGAGTPFIDLARLRPRGAVMRRLRGAEIALIPQEPMAAFSPGHTVGQQIIEAIMLHAGRHPDGWAMSRHDARAMTIELFHDVGVSMPEQRVDAYSWQLSGGLRQRAMPVHAGDPETAAGRDSAAGQLFPVPQSVRALMTGLRRWPKMNPAISVGYSSFPRKRESRTARPRRLPPVQARGKLWTPAFAGVTITHCKNGLHFG
jgi:ABC-type lipoprotein export system ATPase subunit